MGKNDGSSQAKGWHEGVSRLFSAFQIVSVLSRGLSFRDLELLADYCSLLSHCFRSLAAAEKLHCRD